MLQTHPFRLTGTVSRQQYAAWGFSLMLLKYAVDAAVVFLVTHTLWTPMDYLSPLLSTRGRLGSATLIGLALWTLPFIWIGISMSARRCRDAGLPLTVVGCYFLPVVNYIFMLVMCVVPSEAERAALEPWKVRDPARKRPDDYLLLTAVLAGALLGLPLVIVFTQVATGYTGSMFIGVPFCMGALAGWIYAAKGRPTIGQLMIVAAALAIVSGGMLLLFAVEGAVCLAMAAPIAWPALLMGALLGAELRRRRPPLKTLAPAFVAPLVLLHWAEPGADGPLRAVSTSIDVHAPPERVFDGVVSFSQLPSPEEWLFRLTGVAYPIRADIAGSGVGAVRHCQFTTGAFVEPITAWEPGKRLAFGVTQQPPTMTESSPYRDLQPAHLEGTFRSRRGEFRMGACGEGVTCLTGTTWYTLGMAPGAYWSLWADWIIGTIHGRVLRHVKSQVETTSTARG